jgi:hypothetical protein
MLPDSKGKRRWAGYELEKMKQALPFLADISLKRPGYCGDPLG